MNVPRRNPAGQILTVVIASFLTVSSAHGEPVSDESSRDTASSATLCVYGGSNGALWLVRMDSVAQELALTPEQTRQFALWADELNAETRQLLRGLLGGTGPEHEQRAAEKHRQAAAVTEAFHRRVVERLEPQQCVRLDELYVRRLGPRALFEPRIVARLGLSTLQQQALRDAVGSGPKLPTEEKLLELLTEAQRRQLREMQGDPFTFPKPHFIQLRPGASNRPQ